MRRYLITGGAGFIGSHLVERLVERGAHVCVLDNLSAGTLENIAPWRAKIQFVQGDICDAASVQRAMEGVTCVVHLAALKSVPKSMIRPRDYHEVNVTGTLTVLLEAQRVGVEKFVFASSSSVYGDVDTFPQQEGCEALPLSPYALSKRMAEQYVELFSRIYSLPAVSLRYFNVFGPRQPLHDEYASVVPKFITCLLQGERPPVFGNGLQSRDFTYIDNVIDITLAACQADLGAGEVINAAGGASWSVLELARAIAEIIGKADIQPHLLPPRTGDIFKSQADIGRLQALLHVTPRYTFREGLHKTIEWFQKCA